MKSQFGKSKLLGASALALGAALASNAAQAADAAAAATDSSTVGELIVTGTRQTGVKAEDSAAPIQVVGGTALAHVGQPDVIQALAQNLPSFNAEATGGDTANLTLAAALRGLNPNDTLVLINGKRRHPTGNLHVDPSNFQGAATADLSLIPVSAIDHIEVLQDGAAAQYGTDAIAGVINIILKDKDHGGVLTGTGGQYYAGDGTTGAGSFNLGLPLTSKGFMSLTGEVRFHDFSHRGGADRRVQNLDGSLKSSDNATDAAGVPHAAQFPNINLINGDAQSTVYNGFYNAGYDITDDIQLYSYGSYSHRTASSYENYRVPSKVSRTVGLVTTYPFPNGFDPREALVEDDFAVTGGAKGKLAGWAWDLATTYGHDKDRISTVDTANASLYADTGVTPTNFYDGSFTSSEWTTNLDVSRDFAVGLASPLNVAFGAEGRWSKYQIGAGDPLSIYKEGGQSFPGFQLTDAGAHTRTNYAGYIDLAADVVKGLHVDLAGRVEHYSDFGATAVGKLTARYDFNPMFAIRGTIANGFRAPTLAEEYYSATNVAPTFAVVQLPANSPAAALAGFSPLKPEESTNYSVGFVAHPISNMQVTLDLYQISIKDRIVATGTLLGLVGTTTVSQGVLNAIAAHGNVLDPGVSYVGISVFTNGANTRTRGVELTATYASDFGDFGHVDWSVAFNYNSTAVTKQFALPAIVSAPAFGQTTLLGPTALSLLTTAAPKTKVVLGAYWSYHRWSVNLRENIYGPSAEIVSTDGTGNNGVWERIGTTGITDLDVGFKINDQLKIDVGANNLFNQKPPTTPNIPDGSGGVRPADGANVYNAPVGFSPFGINGGYYYGRVTYTF
ncbi:TonB-dependent receptor plug domain-containing protein [Caulobacter sp. KR2-114]|uniref:TonB-dependent receptor plug domain-containing protein n=1 Tax=Caulobacter sp. KR2-114 TaxID=3400912 RepID=UPI003C0CB349